MQAKINLPHFLELASLLSQNKAQKQAKINLHHLHISAFSQAKYITGQNGRLIGQKAGYYLQVKKCRLNNFAG